MTRRWNVMLSAGMSQAYGAAGKEHVATAAARALGAVAHCDDGAVSDGALGRQASMMPQLSVRRGRAAVAFYKAAFGAVEDYRVGGTDDDESVVAQLSVGTASFWVADESPPHGTFSPESLGGGTVRMLLIVEDPGSVVARAVAAGATEVSPVGEEHGWRLGRIADPFGHHWEIGRPLSAWPPAGGCHGS